MVTRRGAKQKGSEKERELLALFWKHGWAAARVAGSGSSKYDSADVLAGNGKYLIAIECKSTRDLSKYIEKDKVESLMYFAEKFGAHPWFAFSFEHKDWFFLRKEDMLEKEKSFLVTKEHALKHALSFDRFITLF